MKPTLSMLGRRALLHAALTAVAWRPNELATAISPPKGSTYLLVPLVEQRILLAESTTAIQRPNANWTSLLGLFDGAPLPAEPQVGVMSWDLRFETQLRSTRLLSSTPPS